MPESGLLSLEPATAPMVSPDPAPDLQAALRSMSWSIEPGRFALVGHPLAPAPADLELLDPPAQLTFEGGETTLLVREEVLAGLLERRAGASVERGLLWVRFEAAMGWEVVGFLALVCGRLAEAGVPLGAVCGFSRDHLFVHERHEATLRAVLGELFPGA